MQAHDSYQKQERSSAKSAPGSKRQAQVAQQGKTSIIDLTGTESEEDA
jgi:hypothetical protein